MQQNFLKQVARVVAVWARLPQSTVEWTNQTKAEAKSKSQIVKS